MAKQEFNQPRENDFDLPNWRKSIHLALYGKDGDGGSLDGNNITNITDPEDITLSTVSVDSADATDLATAITLVNEIKADLNTLVTDVNNGFTKMNSLMAELRDTLGIFT
jgi:hypothetical protein